MFSSRALSQILSIVLIVIIVAAGVLGGSAIYRSVYGGPSTSSRSTSIQTSSYPSGQAYLNTGEPYSSYGYPKLTYESYSPYSPSNPNYTLDYQTTNVGRFQIGTLVAPVLNLSEAVGLAALSAGLDPSNYTLSMADFEPGLVVNGTLVSHPSWILTFARIYEGFWLFGDIGNYESSVSTSVDALNGAVSGVQTSYWSLPPSNGTEQNFRLVVNSSRALNIVRTSTSISGVPEALLQNGTVESIEPRIVLLGPTSQNEFFQKPLNSSLSGQYRLCWIVQLFSPVPQFGYSGTFAVDAETGQLDSGDAIMMFPSMEFEYVSSSLNYSSASGVKVSNEQFGIDGTILGRTGANVPVEVTNVILIKPGSAGSIDLNFSSNLPNSIDVNFSFVNPLGNFQTLSSGDLPSGVSIHFASPTVVVPSNGTASTTMEISAAANARSGTYLLQVVASSGSQFSTSTTFFITIWNGSGQWPPPPNI